MSDAKTKPTPASAGDFIDTVEPAVRREDARALDAMFRRVSGQPPVMWGGSIIGYGRYHYRYESGREGGMCRIGFAPRKSALVLYLEGKPEELMARLGKHTTGVGCLYIKKLADVDMDVLERIVTAAQAHMDAAYPG